MTSLAVAYKMNKGCGYSESGSNLRQGMSVLSHFYERLYVRIFELCARVMFSFGNPSAIRVHAPRVLGKSNPFEVRERVVQSIPVDVVNRSPIKMAVAKSQGHESVDGEFPTLSLIHYLHVLVAVISKPGLNFSSMNGFLEVLGLSRRNKPFFSTDLSASGSLQKRNMWNLFPV